jgi:Arc/MetJ family transcription regulator
MACFWHHRVRTTIDIDEELLVKASKLGGSQPGLRIPRRRR